MNIVEFKRREANRPRAADEAGTSATTAAHDVDVAQRARKYDNSQKLPLKVNDKEGESHTYTHIHTHIHIYTHTHTTHHSSTEFT